MRPGRILLMLLAMVCVAPAAGLADELVQVTRSAMIARLLPAVVNITSYIGAAEPPSGNMVTAATQAGGRPKTLDGSGFIVDPAGYIATNYHVVAGAYRIVVMFSDGTTADAKLFGSVPIGDIAVLRVNVETQLTAVKWGDSDQLQIGDPVKELAQARELLLKEDAYSGESDHGATKSVYGADPDGNEFEIMVLLPRQEWGTYEHGAPIMPLDWQKELHRP